MNTRATSLTQINKALAEAGIVAQMVKGERWGFAFVANGQTTQQAPRRLFERTVEEWVAAAVKS